MDDIFLYYVRLHSGENLRLLHPHLPHHSTHSVSSAHCQSPNKH